jgi:hypothetical protein
MQEAFVEEGSGERGAHDGFREQVAVVHRRNCRKGRGKGGVHG